MEATVDLQLLRPFNNQRVAVKAILPDLVEKKMTNMQVYNLIMDLPHPSCRYLLPPAFIGRGGGQTLGDVNCDVLHVSVNEGARLHLAVSRAPK